VLQNAVAECKKVQRLKTVAVGETMQHLAVMLLKVCVSSRVATL
jgi:hypothetical protein